MPETAKKEETHTEIGTVPVYKRAKNLMAFSQFVCDLKIGEKVVGDVCNGLNGDIIISIKDDETYVVKAHDLLEFISKRK